MPKMFDPQASILILAHKVDHQNADSTLDRPRHPPDQQPLGRFSDTIPAYCDACSQQRQQLGSKNVRREHKKIEALLLTKPATGFDRQLALHIVILLIVSIGFESLFLHHGLSAMDEGWPLHAAMELHDGKTLYDEVFWVFPPGHLLPAWIAYGIDAPGIVATRILYSAFTVALCLALLFVARRIMPADFALLAVLLVAVAAPRSHFDQLLFGYRYLVWSVIALLLFQTRLTRDDSRWLFAAGIFTGIALFFRLTPAFATSVAIGVGIAAASRDWRRWLRDGLWYTAGLLLIWVPLLLWFQHSVGIEKFWIEMVVRPVEMTALQSRPLPPLLFENLDRAKISFAFAAIGFRFFWLLYAGFLITLAYLWIRRIWEQRAFEHTFLLTFVVFGAVYFTRSLGRSDVPHLDSAIPPVAVLLAYCASLLTRLEFFQRESNVTETNFARLTLCILIFGGWIFVNGSDRFLDQEAMMGDTALENTTESIMVRPRSLGKVIDRLIPVIQEHAEPNDTILVMTHAPLFYVLADRHSPGYFDLVMPGTFRGVDEERDYVDRLRENPPAVVVWPKTHFDNLRSRGLEFSAPKLSEWVIQNYNLAGDSRLYRILIPKPSDE